MKKTLIAVACAAFISTGAMAKPASHQPSKPHNSNHTVQVVNKAPHKSAPHISNHGAPAHHSSHHGGGVHVAHVYTAPPPPAHHHQHYHHSSHLDLGDALIAFAILATAF